MAFEGLSEKLQNTFKKLTGKGILSEKDIDEAMREVRMALLEADVNYKVVKDFVSEMKSKSMDAPNICSTYFQKANGMAIAKNQHPDAVDGNIANS